MVEVFRSSRGSEPGWRAKTLVCRRRRLQADQDDGSRRPEALPLCGSERCGRCRVPARGSVGARRDELDGGNEVPDDGCR